MFCTVIVLMITATILVYWSYLGRFNWVSLLFLYYAAKILLYAALLLFAVSDVLYARAAGKPGSAALLRVLALVVVVILWEMLVV